MVQNFKKKTFKKCKGPFTPRGGYRIPRGRGPQLLGGEVPTYKLAGFSQKLHEIKTILVRMGGGAPRAPPLDPPLTTDEGEGKAKKITGKTDNIKENFFACVSTFGPCEWAQHVENQESDMNTSENNT